MRARLHAARVQMDSEGGLALEAPAPSLTCGPGQAWPPSPKAARSPHF